MSKKEEDKKKKLQKQRHVIGMVGDYGWYNLRNAIIKLAISDYKHARRRKRHYSGEDYRIKDLEKFFRVYVNLYLPDTDITGAQILAIVQRECEEEEAALKRKRAQQQKPRRKNIKHLKMY